MFKVGDIVEITEKSSATGMLDFVVGRGYTVLETAHHTTNLTEPVKVYYLKIKVRDESGVGGWYTASHFKLKEEAKVEKEECLFKEGQVVWDLIEGSCVVEALVDDQEEYCVKVRFKDGGWDYYTADGKLHVDDNVRRLFFSEPKIEAATEPVFEPVLKKGDVVVMVNKSARWPGTVIEVHKEDVEWVKSDLGSVFHKNSFDFYKVGEKINFK